MLVWCLRFAKATVPAQRVQESARRSPPLQAHTVSDCLSRVRLGQRKHRFVGAASGRVSARFRLTLTSAGAWWAVCRACTTQQGAVWPAGLELLLRLRNADVTQTPDTHSQLGDSQLFVVSGAQSGCAVHRVLLPQSPRPRPPGSTL